MAAARSDGRRQRPHIEDFAIRGAPAVEVLCVKGGKPRAIIGGIDLRHVPATIDLVGRTQLVDAATLGDRLISVDDAWAGGYVARVIAGAGTGPRDAGRCGQR